jgi:hypothetical protein
MYLSIGICNDSFGDAKIETRESVI